MNSVSKVKIAVGYTLLLGVLFFSLFFVHREMEHLMLSDNRDVQWTDSLITLLRKKDANTIYMLRVLSETNDSMVSTREIENIIATRQDSFVTNQRVQQRIITHRDTVVTKPRKKGFFRRLGEVFVPPKKDTAIQVKTSLEYATDTVINVYNPVDSLQEKLRAVAQQQKEHIAIVQRRRRTLQRMDRMLTARIDSLLKGYEQETLQRAREEAEYQQSVRHHSIKTISGIAVGAVLLSVFFLIIIGRDITRSNRYRRELEEARRRAEDLLATREKMMLAITHDFKAPLGSIMGYADLLSRLTVDERQRFYLDNMKTSSEHLLKLVVDLLDFHRLDLHKAEINRVTFHPARLLEEIHVSFEPLTSAKGLELHCDIAPELESTYICDPLRLRQIINNLLSNAVKFTPAGGTVSVRIRQYPGTVKGSELYEIRVKDNGIGMSQEFVQKIFSPFERERTSTVSRIQGTGLGMAITKNIVNMMGGTIEVLTEQGKGTEFIVRLPFRIQSEHQRIEKIAELEGLKALVVDDDFNTCDSVTKMLVKVGMRSEWTLSGKEAVLRARQSMEMGDAFHAYIIDWRLPDMNGIEVTRQIRSLGDDTPIIILTAYDWSDIEVEARAAGVTAFCAKPMFMSDIRDTLMTAIGQKQAEAETAILPAAGSDFRGKCILLVEDNELNSEIAAEILNEYGFLVDTAENGAEAVEKVKNSKPGNYDLVLMDVQMPVMNGYEATKQIRGLDNPTLAGITILAMTANAFDEDKKKALECGMDGFVSKPIVIEELISILQKNLD